MLNNRYIKNIQNYNKKIISIKNKNMIKERKNKIKHKVNYQSLRIPLILCTENNSKLYFSNNKNEPQKINIKKFIKLNTQVNSSSSKKDYLKRENERGEKKYKYKYYQKKKKKNKSSS